MGGDARDMRAGATAGPYDTMRVMPARRSTVRLIVGVVASGEHDPFCAFTALTLDAPNDAVGGRSR